MKSIVGHSLGDGFSHILFYFRLWHDSSVTEVRNYHPLCGCNSTRYCSLRLNADAVNMLRSHICDPVSATICNDGTLPKFVSSQYTTTFLRFNPRGIEISRRKSLRSFSSSQNFHRPPLLLPDTSTGCSVNTVWVRHRPYTLQCVNDVLRQNVVQLSYFLYKRCGSDTSPLYILPTRCVSAQSPLGSNNVITSQLPLTNLHQHHHEQG